MGRWPRQMWEQRDHRCESSGPRGVETAQARETLQPLAELWNGATWRAPRAPVPAGATDSGFDGVDCAPGAGTEFCMAVGQFETKRGRGVAFAESWNGTAWTLRPVPIPHVADESSLAAVIIGVVSRLDAVKRLTHRIMTRGPHAIRRRSLAS